MELKMKTHLNTVAPPNLLVFFDQKVPQLLLTWQKTQELMIWSPPWRSWTLDLMLFYRLLLRNLNRPLLSRRTVRTPGPQHSCCGPYPQITGPYPQR